MARNSNKEIRIVVDDSVIDTGDIMAIIEPVWESVYMCEGEDEYINELKKFSKPQKYAFAMFWYMCEVDNGGHEQFYYNSAGIAWEDAIEGFGEAGLLEVQKILKESAKRLGGNPSKDRQERIRQLENIKPNFDDLDESYYELEEETHEALADYIKKNRQAFYFNGVVSKPQGNR
ncbi:MAG: DMP19 family protein [Sedimentisphaerales bacterium]